MQKQKQKVLNCFIRARNTICNNKNQFPGIPSKHLDYCPLVITLAANLAATPAFLQGLGLNQKLTK